LALKNECKKQIIVECSLKTLTTPKNFEKATPPQKKKKKRKKVHTFVGKNLVFVAKNCFLGHVEYDHRL